MLFGLIGIIVAVSSMVHPNIVIGFQESMSSPNTNQSSSSLNNLFKQVDNSVVQITSKVRIDSNPADLQTQNATALGSGFIYDNKGHIITNSHVVIGAPVVDVTFIDGNRYTARVMGADIYSDIAVLQIIENITTVPYPKPLVFGNSSQVEVGQQVVAIGNPFGLENSMTTGIVSQIGRLLPSQNLGFSIPDAIQTDAPINPGNSGGPLLDLQGSVIGMNTAVVSSSSTPGFSGVAFAIPSNTISRIVPSLLQNGTYTHPFIGLEGATLTSDLAKSVNGLPPNFKGIFVDSVSKNGPADRAGLNGSSTDQYKQKHGGDVITAVDGHNVTQIEDFIGYLDEHTSVGQNVTLTVHRDGKTIDLKATLDPRPSSIAPYILQKKP
jgi:S1-C subfamily serine protease